MWRRQQQVGSQMACALFVNLVEWKVWKPHSRDCWMKITIVYNFRNVYQTKDIQPWSESLKSIQVWVIEKSNNCALAHCSCKSTAAENTLKTLIAMWQTLSRSKLFSTRTLIIIPLSLLWLPWHQFELDAWSWLLASFRVRDKIS